MNKSCSYFDNYKCRSCSLLGEVAKLPALPSELIKLSQIILPWQKCQVAFGSRAKAKMSVSGSKDKPIIGILDSELKGIELLECPLHKKIINDCLKTLPKQISKLGLEPYDIEKKTGNLKNIILQTNSSQDHLRLRVVLRESKELKILEQIKFSNTVKYSLSANIQPIAHQIPEGLQEHQILGEELLWEKYNGVKVAFPAQSFMQVTPEIASRMYQSASDILAQYSGATLVDLFCGAGGFALSTAKHCKKVLGIEISETAVEAAKVSALENGIKNIEFIQADLLQSLQSLIEISADVLICNPPRRGIGENVINAIKIAKPKIILYSSCHALNFLKDYEKLSDHYIIKECTPFEMFPLTNHYEILAVLEKKSGLTHHP